MSQFTMLSIAGDAPTLAFFSSCVLTSRGACAGEPKTREGCDVIQGEGRIRNLADRLASCASGSATQWTKDGGPCGRDLSRRPVAASSKA